MALIVGLNRAYNLDDLYGKFISTRSGYVFSSILTVPKGEVNDVVFISKTGTKVIDDLDHFEIIINLELKFWVPRL